jgi:hypothetical protein
MIQAGLKDAIAALEGLDSASTRKRVCSQLIDLFNYLAAVHRKNGNQPEVSISSIQQLLSAQLYYGFTLPQRVTCICDSGINNSLVAITVAKSDIPSMMFMALTQETRTSYYVSSAYYMLRG